MSDDRRSIGFRTACQVLSVLLALMVLSLALPWHRGQIPLAELARKPVALALVLFLLAIPLFFAVRTLVASVQKAPPGFGSTLSAGILAVVVSMGMYAALLSMAYEGSRDERVFAAMGTSFPVLGAFVVLRARHRVGWERWANLVASPFLAALPLGLAAALASTKRASGFTAASLLALCLGIGFPVAIWIVFPRRRAYPPPA